MYVSRYKPPGFMQKVKKIIAVVLVSGTITGLGLGAFVIGVNEIIGATSSKEWPTVNGTIIRSKILVSEHKTSRANQTSQTEDYYLPDVAYRYSINGVTLQGDNIRYGLATNKAQAEKIVQQYSVGKVIEIYYNPDNSEQSVLQPGYFGGLFFFPIMGFIGILAGVFSGWIIKDLGD